MFFHFIFFLFRSTVCVNYALNGDYLEISGVGNVEKDKIDLYTPSKIKKIVILNGIKGIMENAFISCINLEEIELPGTLEIIEACAFQKTQLKTLHLPASVHSIDFTNFLVSTNRLQQISIEPTNPYFSVYSHCLYNKNQTELLLVPLSIDSLIIAQSATIFGECSFGFCKLNQIHIPDHINIIRKKAFSNCYASQIIFSENSNLNEIASSCFYRARLVSICVPPILKVINSNAFQETSALINFTVMDGSNLQRLESNSFLESKGLQFVFLPSSISYISTSAFTRCSSLQEIIINGESQYYKVYDNCIFNQNLSSLIFIPSTKKNLTIPNQTCEIASGILQLSNLESIEVDENNTFFKALNGVLYNKDFTTVLAVLGSKSEIHIDSRATEMVGSLFYGIGTKNVTFSDDSKMKTISNKCFATTTDLTYFKVPPNVNILVSFCFEKSSIEVVVISANVKTIQYGAFRYSNLREVIFEAPSKLEQILEYGFYNTRITSIFLPSNLQSILSMAFSISDIEEITIPKSVDTLGEKSFTEAKKLKVVRFESNSVLKTLPGSTFESCPLLHTVEIPGSLESIGLSCFKNCPSLNTIVWKEESSLTSLGSESFSGCGFTSFSIPSSLGSIDAGVFFGCNSLTNFELPEKTNFSTLNGVLYSKNFNILIVCPHGIVSHEISPEAESIANNAFGYSAKLKSVTFAEGCQIEEIGERTFYECVLLSRIEFPSTLKKVLSHAFEGCIKLSTVIFVDDPSTNRNNLLSLGGSSFSGCTLLSEVQLGHPLNFETIEASTFKGCKLLQKFVFPSSVSLIGDSAFESCSALSNVSIDSGSLLKSIGSACFKGSSIESIDLPAGLTALGRECFSSCSKLKHIFIRSNSESFSVGEYCFVGCNNLQTLVFCGKTDPNCDSAFGSGSGKLSVYVLTDYQNETFCGYPAVRIMSGCGIFPSEQFTVQGTQDVNICIGILLDLVDWRD